MKWLKAYRTEILIFSCFILLSLILTYPLILKIKSHVYGYSGDPLGLVWYIWWLKYSWLNHIPSSFCPLIAAPFGVNAAHPSIYIISTLLQKSLAILVNEIFAYNLLIFFSFPLAAITMYYLVFYFTKNKVASMFSGIIYAFSPCHFAQAAQHFGLAQIQWMPLYLLALFNLEEERSYRYALLTALVLSLVTFTDYYHLYFMLIMTIAFILWGMWQGLRNRRLSGEQKPVSRTKPACRQGRDQACLPARQGSRMHFFRVILAAILLTSAFILPFTHSLLREVFIAPTSVTKAAFFRPLQDLFTNSARPLSYLLPSQDNFLFGRYTKGFIGSHFYGWSGTEHALYLGYAVIILSIVAIREWRRRNKLQAASHKPQATKVSSNQDRQTGKLANWSTRTQKGVSFFLFAGIVALLFSHAPYSDMGNFRIFFPSYFMYKLLPMVRVYARFGILVMLCLSVLAGMGLKLLLERRTGTRKRILLALIILVVFIEFMPRLPAPTFDATVFPIEYKWLSQQEGDFIIVEYPLEGEQEYLFYQRIHQKRLVNSPFPDTRADKIKKKIINISDPETPGILAYLGVRYVFLHPDKYLESEDVKIIGELPNLRRHPGLKAIATPGSAQIFRVTARPIKPAIEMENERN